MDTSQLSKGFEAGTDEPIRSPKLGMFGWLRWIWNQLTSMKTALLLLLLLAAAAIPGSIYPQRSADPNGVTTYFQENPQLAQVLDQLQLFDVYSSAWFSAIYILLFISLIGCVIPRVGVHAKALLKPPVATPSNLKRMPAYLAVPASAKLRADLLDRAAKLLRKQGYRVAVEPRSVAAERGYWRETGNLVFHISLVGLLIAVGFGGAYSYSGQRILVEGDTFVDNLAGYDSFSPGLAFNESMLPAFSMRLDKFTVRYDLRNGTNIGTPLDFAAAVSVLERGAKQTKTSVIKVNEPLEVPGAKVYLTGNGYAPLITIRDGKGQVAFSGPVVFLPQDNNMTSLGVIKVPDAKPSQFGVLAFFYPTAAQLESKAFTSGYPDLVNPLLTMNIYEGDLGLDSGIPSNVFSLAVHGLKQLTGGKTGVESMKLEPGQSLKLPNGLGEVSFDGIRRYASLDMSYNPGQGWVLAFALLALAGLMLSLLVPRRRVWVKLTDDGFQLAALARGDDPQLVKVVADLAKQLKPATSASSSTSSKKAK